MGIVFLIQRAVAEEIGILYGLEILPESVQVNETKPEFEGDYTVVLFASWREFTSTGMSPSV